MSLFSPEDKKNLINEAKVKLEASYREILGKLEKRAKEIEEESKRTVDQALAQVKFGPSTH